MFLIKLFILSSSSAYFLFSNSYDICCEQYFTVLKLNIDDAAAADDDDNDDDDDIAVVVGMKNKKRNVIRYPASSFNTKDKETTSDLVHTIK